MATYRPADFRKSAVPGNGDGGSVKAVQWTVYCAAAPATTDIIEFGYLPAGSRVLFATLEATDMDTAVSPSITLDIGDAGDADRLFAASTVAQAGTLSSAIAVAGAGATYSTRTMITGVANANATTGAAGTLNLTIFYTVN